MFIMFIQCNNFKLGGVCEERESHRYCFGVLIEIFTAGKMVIVILDVSSSGNVRNPLTKQLGKGLYESLFGSVLCDSLVLYSFLRFSYLERVFMILLSSAVLCDSLIWNCSL